MDTEAVGPVSVTSRPETRPAAIEPPASGSLDESSPDAVEATEEEDPWTQHCSQQNRESTWSERGESHSSWHGWWHDDWWRYNGGERDDETGETLEILPDVVLGWLLLQKNQSQIEDIERHPEALTMQPQLTMAVKAPSTCTKKECLAELASFGQSLCLELSVEEPGHLVRKNRVEHGYMKGKIDGEPDLMDRVVRETVANFGRHKGRSFKEIAEMDMQYLRWAVRETHTHGGVHWQLVQMTDYDQREASPPKNPKEEPVSSSNNNTTNQELILIFRALKKEVRAMKEAQSEEAAGSKSFVTILKEGCKDHGENTQPKISQKDVVTRVVGGAQQVIDKFEEARPGQAVSQVWCPDRLVGPIVNQGIMSGSFVLKPERLDQSDSRLAAASLGTAKDLLAGRLAEDPATKRVQPVKKESLVLDCLSKKAVSAHFHSETPSWGPASRAAAGILDMGCGGSVAARSGMPTRSRSQVKPVDFVDLRGPAVSPAWPSSMGKMNDTERFHLE
ncbi:unnamed protein product, partial [Symbiodinium microadriaticum]